MNFDRGHSSSYNVNNHTNRRYRHENQGIGAACEKEAFRRSFRSFQYKHTAACIELMARALVKDARAAYDNPQIRQQYEEHTAAKRK